MQESTVLKGETRSFFQHRKLHILPLKLEIFIINKNETYK